LEEKAKMRFSLPASLVIATFSALAAAQNPFTFTTLTSITAGTPFNITWAPSTGTVQTVTLVLRQGDPTHLTTIQTIARMSLSLSPMFLSTQKKSPNTNGVPSINPKHRLLPLDTPHLPRSRHRLRLRDHQRPEQRHRQLLEPILYHLYQYRVLCCCFLDDFLWCFYLGYSNYGDAEHDDDDECEWDEDNPELDVGQRNTEYHQLGGGQRGEYHGEERCGECEGGRGVVGGCGGCYGAFVEVCIYIRRRNTLHKGYIGEGEHMLYKKGRNGNCMAKKEGREKGRRMLHSGVCIGR
jgi:hypothetical protein